MKKQTAVEWLSEYVMAYLSMSEETITAINKAKVMEKQQIKEAYKEGESDGTHEVDNAEQYYNETYHSGDINEMVNTDTP